MPPLLPLTKEMGKVSVTILTLKLEGINHVAQILAHQSMAGTHWLADSKLTCW